MTCGLAHWRLALSCCRLVPALEAPPWAEPVVVPFSSGKAALYHRQVSDEAPSPLASPRARSSVLLAEEQVMLLESQAVWPSLPLRSIQPPCLASMVSAWASRASAVRPLVPMALVPVVQVRHSGLASATSCPHPEMVATDQAGASAVVLSWQSKVRERSAQASARA